MEKKFKCKDEVIYRRTDEKSEWTYGIFSHYYDYNNVEGVVVDGHFLLSTVHNILPYEGNEELVGTTDEPQIPLSEKEIQDAYWNNCTEIEKENLRKNYSILLKEDGRGKFILEKFCGKHNLQTDSPDEEVRLEEGEWIMYPFGGIVSIYPLDYNLGKFIKIIDRENNIEVQDSDSVRGSSKFIRFKDYNPNDMEETSRHILCVKGGKIVRYKG